MKWPVAASAAGSGTAGCWVMRWPGVLLLLVFPFQALSSDTSIDALIADSPSPPVIILQADHGTCARYCSDLPVAEQEEFIRERMAILNAYYLPVGGKGRLYPTITPVNTFRVVFGTLFGEDLELLPDRQYISWLDRPYDLVDVTEQLKRDGQGSGEDMGRTPSRACGG